MIKKRPKASIAEAYRMLRTNIQFSNINKDIKSIVITSSGINEGKSTVGINLAIAVAQTNKKVLLIDSDLRSPTIHKFIGIQNYTGLTNILVDNVDFKKLIKSVDNVENLDILISGPIPQNPSELLGSSRMKKFLQRISSEYDMILLDSPPVGLVTDAAILSIMVDGTILVCEAGQTEIEELKNVKSSLEKIHANILGVVMNKIPLDNEGRFKYRGYYSYGADKSGKNLSKKRKRLK